MDAGIFPPHKGTLELMRMGFIILEQAALEKGGNNSQHMYPPGQTKAGN
jgi:hypothetical protein